jgi:hypothetical protein
VRPFALVIAFFVAAVLAGAALATVRPVRPGDGPLLARAPTYEERVAESVARRLTGKKSNIRCGTLGVPGAAWPTGVAGITLFQGGQAAGYALLLPEVCAELVAFRSNPSSYDPDACADTGCLQRDEEAVFALQTVTHESYHLLGYRNEAQVECYGLQSIWYAAAKLGAPTAVGQSLARFYTFQIYPQRRLSTPQYWTAECRDGGKYDLRPNTHAWPS